MTDRPRNSFALPIYLPSFLLSTQFTGQNLIIPLYLKSLGFSLGQIGLLIGAFGIGNMLGELPTGILLNRFTQRRMMFFGAMVLAASTIGLAFTTNLWLFALLRLLAGYANVTIALSRHAYMAENSVNQSRGKKLAGLGGVARVAKVVGPIMGGRVADVFSFGATFFLFGALVAVSGLLIFIFVPKGQVVRGVMDANPFVEIVAVALEQWRILMTAGIAQMMMQMVRSAPNTLIPLVGDSLGLSASAIGIIETVRGACDTLFFWTSGIIMDRWGRKFAIVPSLLVQSLGVVAIPFMGSFTGLLLVAGLIGLGNSISSGTMMTLAADLAPSDTRNTFLSLFRLNNDIGSAVSPNLIGGIGEAFALTTSALVVGGLGVLGAALFIFGVPETLKR